jgi:hypothetical protein
VTTVTNCLHHAGVGLVWIQGPKPETKRANIQDSSFEIPCLLEVIVP